jgi:hypothetical protein
MGWPIGWQIHNIPALRYPVTRRTRSTCRYSTEDQAEGRVYVCSWKNTGKDFRVWVKYQRGLRAAAATFEEADERLAGKILAALGDGENVREYVPPPPETQSGVELLDYSIVEVNGNEHLPIAGEPAPLFSGGICRKCGSFLGERTDVPLTLRCFTSGYDGGFVWQQPFQFFSEAFLKRLKPGERSSFDWRPVHAERPSRQVFYELRPKNIVPWIAVKGFKFDVIRCAACRTLRGLHAFRKDTPIYHYMSVSDLPKPLPACFAAGLPTSFHLCFQRKRWLELVGKPGAKGLVSTPIGVVAETVCERIRNQTIERR